MRAGRPRLTGVLTTARRWARQERPMQTPIIPAALANNNCGEEFEIMEDEFFDARDFR